MQIDSHQHFWKYSPFRQTWISDEMSKIKRDFSPSDLEPLLKARGFDGCVAVQADTTEDETHFLLSLAEKYEFIKGVVGWLDLKSPDLAKKLDRYGAHPKLVGLRHTIQSEADGFMLNERFINGVALLKEYNLTYDILIHEKQLEEAAQMIGRLPEMKLVIDHIAKPNIKQQSFDHWAKWMGKLSEYPHVYVKLSGMATEADWKSWSKQDFRPYIDFCLEKMGPDRLMIGSDWPVCLVAGSYEQVIEATVSNLTGLAESDQRAILGENATNFYNLK